VKNFCSRLHRVDYTEAGGVLCDVESFVRKSAVPPQHLQRLLVTAQ
jgi:hypothetical protein